MGKYGKNPINTKQTQTWYHFVELGKLNLNMYNISVYYGKIKVKIR